MTQSLHIGIVACSAEGAALCYRTICDEAPALMGEHRHPEVSMHTHSLGEYMDRIHRDDWPGVAELMLSSAGKLKACGADFLICPDNTIHRAWPFVAPRAPLPWLHIVEEVAAEARRRGFRRVGITGTRYTMASDLYPSVLARLGLEYRVPPPAAQEALNRIIFEELVLGVFRPESIAVFLDAIEGLKAEGCDAVVLGCTEIPLIVTPENSPLPVLDSTRLLARAALRKAVVSPAPTVPPSP
ncbi:MAG: amino acid racemase [Holophagaceae bacterium]|nr:amino acid racemase [Holophagaceae bacterium]